MIADFAAAAWPWIALGLMLAVVCAGILRKKG